MTLVAVSTQNPIALTRTKAVSAGDAVDSRSLFRIPNIPCLRLQPTRIAEEDERELRWFLGSPVIAGMRSGSGFGGQLERAAAYGYGALPCRRCGGRWRVRRGLKAGKCVSCASSVPAGAESCPECHVSLFGEWQDGTGLAPRDRFGKRVSYQTALAAFRTEQQAKLRIATISAWPKQNQASGIDAARARAAIVEAFKARGQTVMTEVEFRELFATLPEERCRTCPACAGLGVVPRRSHSHAEVTAWPTGSSKQLGGHERDDEAAITRKAARGGVMVDGNGAVNLDELERYMHMSMMLADVASVAPLARAALEQFYRQPNGRASLRELTPTGTEREIAELQDFIGQAWNFVAWGNAS